MNSTTARSAEILKRLREACTTNALGMNAFREDTLGMRLSATQCRLLLEAALEDGRRHAAHLRQSFAGSPEDIAYTLGVLVIDTTESLDYGTTTVFAEYRTAPSAIVICSGAVGKMQRMLQRGCPREAAATVDCRQVFIAHELYHHLDGAEQTPLTGRLSVEVLRMGQLVLRRPLPLLEELAAGAFAQSLLGLPFHPRLLDVMFVCDENPSQTVQVLYNMRQYCGDSV